MLTKAAWDRRRRSRRAAADHHRTAQNPGFTFGMGTAAMSASASEFVPQPTQVVVVEDEAIIRLDIIEMLSTHGYRVVGHTGRASEATALILAMRPDLVILDEGLATEAMSGTFAHPSRPVAVVETITGLTRPSDHDSPRGWVRILKPFGEEELLAATDHALTNASRGTPVTSATQPQTCGARGRT